MNKEKETIDMFGEDNMSRYVFSNILLALFLLVGGGVFVYLLYKLFI